MPAMAGMSVENTNAAPYATSQQYTQVRTSHANVCNINGASYDSELERLKKTSSEHYSFVELQNKVGALSEDTSHQLHAINHYAFIREASFSEPDFGLIKEFNPPDPTLKSINDARYPNNQLPWYIAPSQQYKLKIAGWQDSNSLYRCNLRFYS